MSYYITLKNTDELDEDLLPSQVWSKMILSEEGEVAILDSAPLVARYGDVELLEDENGYFCYHSSVQYIRD